jgi:hypothetical protein
VYESKDSIVKNNYLSVLLRLSLLATSFDQPRKEQSSRIKIPRKLIHVIPDVVFLLYLTVSMWLFYS